MRPAANLFLTVPNVDLPLGMTGYKSCIASSKVKDVEHLRIIVMRSSDKFKLSTHHGFVGCTSMEYNLPNSFVDMTLPNQTNDNQYRKRMSMGTFNLNTEERIVTVL